MSDRKSSKRSKIIILCSNKSPFVERDISLVQQLGCHVITIVSPPKKNLFSFFHNRLKELFLVLLHGHNSSAVICWFNDYHAFIPNLLSKILSLPPVVIIVGGYDAVSYKELSHGLFSRNNIRQYIGRFNFRSSDKIWVVHKSLADGCPVSRLSQMGIESGILTFLPELKTPIEEVPTAYDSTFWSLSTSSRSFSILTVGLISNERTFQIKGIPLFLELAKMIPDMKFKVIGIATELIDKGLIPKLKNLVLHDPVDQGGLIREYQDSTFYFQGSIIEGLPNVLCEAMLCGCIPIGRPIFGIPDAIGDTGYLIDDPQNLQHVVDFIYNVDLRLGLRARERIIDQFPLKKRVEKFSSLLRS